MLGFEPLASAPLSATSSGGGASTVTGVTVSPGAASGSQTFTATVNGTGSPSQAVTWSVSAGSINSSGAFVEPAQTGSQQTITIIARSVEDPAYFGTALVTIAGSGGAAPPSEVKRKPIKKILPPSDKPTRSEIVSELDGIAEMFGQGYEGRLLDPQPKAAPQAMTPKPMFSPMVMQMRAKYLKKAINGNT